MRIGYLKVNITTKNGSLPVQGTITISNGETLLYQLQTDKNGVTEIVALEAPANDSAIPYSVCDVRAEADGFIVVNVFGVHIFENETSILPINMTPSLASMETIDIHIPPHKLTHPTKQQANQPSSQQDLPHQELCIPEYITVFIQQSDKTEQHKQISFIDYIQNVASHTIYPSWPLAAIEANIYCIISLTLNLLYTKKHQMQGYDITTHEQTFVEGGHIIGSICSMVECIFNRCIVQEGHPEPLYAQYSDGKYITCPGLWQWNTVQLAERGHNALDILRHFYPQDIEIVEINNTKGNKEPFPGYPLKEGMSGSHVQHLQVMLNQIGANFQAIPAIEPGEFGPQTTAAVLVFKNMYNFDPISPNDIESTTRRVSSDGIVDKITWNRISRTLSVIIANSYESEHTKPVKITKIHETNTTQHNNNLLDKIPESSYEYIVSSQSSQKSPEFILSPAHNEALNQASNINQLAFKLALAYCLTT